MPRLQVGSACATSDQVWTDKDQWRSLLSDCYEFAMWDKNPYWGTGTGAPQGKRNTMAGQEKISRRVYDSTLMQDAAKLANRLQYELFPIGHEWAELEPGPFIDKMQADQARQDLHNLQKLLFMVIQLSNFDLAIAEWLLELVVAGTACMLVSKGDDDNPVIYTAVSQAHVAFRCGAHGQPDFVSRKHKMRLSVIPQTWLDAKDLPKVDPDEKDGDPECDLIDVLYYSAPERRWYYDVIVTGGLPKTESGQDKVRVVERTYQYSPWIIARWSKAADESHGRSLVMQALPDARTLSAVKSFILRQAALQIGGVFLVRNDGVINANSVRIFPGATIPVRSTGGGNAGASVAPLQVGGDVNFADLVTRDLINSIHQIMLNDGMPDVSEGVRTATELIERMKELQQSLGAPFSRVLKEGIIPLLEATIYTLGEMGLVPIAEGQKVKLNGGEIKVKFQSPLVQGQSIREVEALDQALTITAKHGGQEAAALSFKIEDMGAFIGSRLGVVPEMMRPKAERASLQDMAGKIAAMQATGSGAPAVGGNGGVQPRAANQQQGGALPLAA